jgi:hypothetical protein
MLGLVLLAAGISLLFIGFLVPMAILYADDTPPVWGTASDGTVALSPKDGDVLGSLGTSVAAVLDSESGVASVTLSIDGTSYSMSLTTGTIYNGVWGKSGLSVPEGTHTVQYTAKNKVGLSTTYTGSFKIYGLNGDWYINNILITGPTQEVYSSSLTVSFKFVKTAGAADSSITCTVAEGGTALLKLTNSAAGTWTGSYTFARGKHTLELKASDGTNTVTMSLFDFKVQTGYEILWNLYDIAKAAGAIMTTVGLVLIVYPFKAIKEVKAR